MIQSIYYQSHASPLQRELSLAQIAQALRNPDGLLWVDLQEPTLANAENLLTGVFNFHPLAIEDCFSTGYQTPKIDDFETYLFIITHALSDVNNNSFDTTLELDIFLGPNYIVTCHNSPILAPIHHVSEMIVRDVRLIENGPDFLCHAILDQLVDDYFPIIDAMDEEIDQLEDKVLQKPSPSVLERILQLKHENLSLRRLISPQRELMNRLSRDEFSVIDAKSRIYFRDIYDHLVRIQELSESLRDIVAGLLDIYLNSTSLRLNETMKALTIVSTIFLPLSFVAGVYGMNFQYMPEIYWRFGYLFAWCIFATIFVSMILFFKKRNWF
jgi:magnesium transporter